MTDDVQESYDGLVELYAQVNLDALERDTNARDGLAAFAALATPQRQVVADLGCGPGHIVDHLTSLGLDVVGYDLSPGQIDMARRTFPNGDYHVADFTDLQTADGSLGGIVSRYSIIHLEPARVRDAFDEWMRVLEPGAPLLVSFFGATSADGHGEAFDHRVVTAYALFPATIAQHLSDAGFDELDVGVLPPPPNSKRPYDQATILANKPR